MGGRQERIKSMTNSQVKVLIKIYEMITNCRDNKITLSDISCKQTITRFECVLNEIITKRMYDNDYINDYYINKRRELKI